MFRPYFILFQFGRLWANRTWESRRSLEVRISYIALPSNLLYLQTWTPVVAMAFRLHRSKKVLRLCPALVSLLLLTFSLHAASKSKSSDAVDFNRDIRPILSENCYACHGPDQNKRKAGLRLDIRTNAISELKSGDIAIVPGKPAESKLLERITNKDDDERMP